MSARAERLRLRAYQVGFGDCLLLSVFYDKDLPDGRRSGHVLIDFGSRRLVPGGPSLGAVAKSIRSECGPTIDAVVATHRHQDHVSGFGDDAALTALDDLEPALVIRPWTDAPADPPPHVAEHLGAASLGFVKLLGELAAQSEKVADAFAIDRTDLGQRAKAIAAMGVPNAKALATLDLWGKGRRTHYAKAGDKIDLGLPEVSVQVLGPPTLEQVPGLRHYASSSTEYWLGLAAEDRIAPELRRGAANGAARTTVAMPDGLGSASWLVEKMGKASTSQVVGIVEGFDEVLNNTSLLLLVTVGKRTLLLAGDAQVENWSWSLDRALAPKKPDVALRNALAGIEVYKVGHHGSRNATPKRLHQLWRDGPRRGPLVSVMSTRSGVYGESKATAVPQDKLVTGLTGVGSLHSTEALPKGAGWFDIEARAKPVNAKYSYTEGPKLD